MTDISVIVPIYNVKNYLRECLDSLIAQTYLACEFICIDDGSEDDSYMIVEDYMKRDQRFHLIRQENRGLAETRNVGIQCAQGKYIAFLDSDDYFAEDNTLNELYKAAEISKLDLLSYETELLYEGNMKEIDDKDFYYYKNHFYPGVWKGKEFFIEMMSNHEYCDSACLLFIRREWLLNQKIQFYPGILYEDALFCMQCFMQAERMGHLSKRFYTYRVREKSIMTSSVRWENVRSRLVIYQEIFNLLIMYGKDDLKLQELMTEYLSLIAFHARYMDEFRIDEPSDETLGPMGLLLTKIMELGSYRIEVDEEIILNGLEKFVVDSEGIILYGAGNAGKLFLHFLKDKGLDRKVLCYAISGEADGRLRVDHIPILPISEAIKKSGRIMISVADEKAQKEMKKNLKKLGVNQFRFFDRYIYRALRHYAEKSDSVNT